MSKKKTEQKPKFAPMDRVQTPRGAGMVIGEVRNLFLMRPGRIYSVELDGGEKIEVREEDMTP